EVLPVDVGVQDPVVARPLEEVVEAGIGVLLQPPDRRQVELDAVVVAVAEEAEAELVVLEEETAEIEVERLDAEPDAVEIVALGRDAELIVDERFLDAE